MTPDYYVTVPHTPEPWRQDAACIDSGFPDAWFPEAGGMVKEADAAIRICRECPVREECLAYALKPPYPHGIWGGLTSRQRRQRRQLLLHPRESA